MKKILALIALLGGLSLTASPIFAWDYYYTGPEHGNVLGGTSGTYKVKINIDDYLPLNSGGSAKAMGMGGAFTAVANDLGGAVEFNPAGLTYLNHVNVSALASANRVTTIGSTGEKNKKWLIIPTYAGAALKVGPLAVALSRKIPQSNSSFLSFSQTQRDIYAPDSWQMKYDTLSDKIDTSKLNTYVLTAAVKLGRLSLGANYNSIDGDIDRELSGRVTTPQPRSWWYVTEGNNQFQATNTVGLKGYTMDFGALMDMGILRLGATAKNYLGKVDVTQKLYWKDNFDMGSNNFFVYDPGQTKETLTKFAPTYTAGAALLLGKIVTLDLDYATVSLQDTKKAMGRLGAELAAIPGFLFLRGGVQADFKNLVRNQDRKNREYFLGAGLKLLALTVDASASLEQAKASSSGDNMSGALTATLKF